MKCRPDPVAILLFLLAASTGAFAEQDTEALSESFLLYLLEFQDNDGQWTDPEVVEWASTEVTPPQKSDPQSLAGDAKKEETL